jgi:hypothetical protein
MEEMEGRKRRDLTARVMNIEYGGSRQTGGGECLFGDGGQSRQQGGPAESGRCAACCLIFFLIVDKVAAGSKAA